MMSTLSINSAKRRDSALFTCLVENLYGKDETNIRLIVQEPPESPKELKLIDRRSREARLSWSQLFNGNSEINRFWITCHIKDSSCKYDLHLLIVTIILIKLSQLAAEFSSFGHLNVTVDNLASEKVQSYTIRDLKPATIYVCSIKSENDVGLSLSSNTIEFKTDEQGN